MLLYEKNYESLSLLSAGVLQVDTVHSKNSLLANMFYHEIKRRDSLIKELARQEANINNAFKAKPIKIKTRNLCLKVTRPIVKFFKV